MRFETLNNKCWIEASFLNKDDLKLSGEFELTYNIHLRGDECSIGTIGCDKYFELESVMWHRDNKYTSSLHCKGDISEALTNEEWEMLQEKLNERNGNEY